MGIDKIDSALMCFLIMAKLNGVAVNEKELLNLRSINENDEMFFVKASKKFSLKPKIYKLTKKNYKDNLSGILPIIIKDNNNDYLILIKINDENVVLLKPDEKAPVSISVNEFDNLFSKEIIIIKKDKAELKETMFSFKWFLPTILKYKKEFINVLIGVFTIQILGLLTPIMTQVIIDKVLTHKSISTLQVLTVGILTVYIFELILSLAKNYLFTHTTNRIDVILNSKLFKHLFDLPLRYFETRKAGETIARVHELNNIRQFLTGTPLSSAIDLMFISVYIIVMFYYNTFLTFVVLGSMVIYAILSLIITPIFRTRLDEKFKAGAKSGSFLVESINGVQSIKSFALEERFEQKWGEIQAEYVKAGYKTAMLSGCANNIASFIQKIFDLLILYYGAITVMEGGFSIGQLVAFRMFSSRVSSPVLRLVQLWQEYQQASLSVRRIGDIFNSPVELKANSNISMLPELEGEIEFKEVSFRYNIEASEAIKDMSFKINAKEVIGIVGRSGSGKSTLAKLIQRLYLPERGKITVDGIDLSLINPKQLRNQIGIVLQENFIFSRTIMENITIHHPMASLEEVIEAAKIAGAHDFILDMGGYDVLIGEKGVGLSGGQKQRIAIARAIISNPRILIFDEATSALDYETESIIQHNLNKICKDRTVLIIAHRLSTLKNVDKIMVVDKGNVVEFDTHEALMKQKGIYYKLYSQQQRGEIHE